MRTSSSPGARFYLILNVIMILMYSCGGIILYFWELPSIPAASRKLFSGILILYSVYRGFVLYGRWRRTQNEDKK